MPGSLFDIGEDTGTSGEYWYGGQQGQSANLRRVEPGGSSTIVDSASSAMLNFTPALNELCYLSTLDVGHTITGTLIYDPNLPIVSGLGSGPTNGIDFLDVNVLDANGNVLFSVIDVKDGVSSYGFLIFEFDTTLKNLVPGSSFDIGEDTFTPGEYYYLGSAGGPADLIYIHPDGTVPTVDITGAATFLFADECAPCNPADLVPPFGQTDLDDIDAFIPLFTDADPSVDFMPPFGVVDLDDLDTFILAYLAGCP